MSNANTAKQEMFSFSSDTENLLRLLSQNVYSGKDVGIRELISNASDALDKVRLAIAEHAGKMPSDNEYNESSIRITLDKKLGILQIEDNGIGMNGQELQKCLGTLGASGTRMMAKEMKNQEKQDGAGLIGKFGVGFYSVFIIGDKVEVFTRKAFDENDGGSYWSSNGIDKYQLTKCPKENHGTQIIVHLRNEAKEFLTDFKLQEIIKKYCNHINFPIYMPAIKDEKDSESNDNEWKQINDAGALWKMAKKDISDSEYKTFYKTIGHDFEDPLTWIHIHIEGTFSYSLLLYIPEKAPLDIMARNFHMRGIKIYQDRVFVTQDGGNILFNYLRFLNGVVDCEDLPISISREALQDDHRLMTIQKSIASRVLAHLKDLANNDREKYYQFWKTFGFILKEGIIEDPQNREKIADLICFSTTYNDQEEKRIFLSEYLDRMGEKQESIFYLTASSFSTAVGSPALEKFRAKGIEVILLSDPVDEWVVTHMTEYKGKKLVSVGQDIDMSSLETDEERQEAKESEANLSDLLKRLKSALGDKVKDVTLTSRLVHSPACIVSPDQMNMNMRRIFQASGNDQSPLKPLLQINPKHIIIQKLNQITDEDTFDKWADLIYGQSFLAESGQIDDPPAFVNTLNDLLSSLL